MSRHAVNLRIGKIQSRSKGAAPRPRSPQVDIRCVALQRLAAVQVRRRDTLLPPKIETYDAIPQTFSFNQENCNLLLANRITESSF